ncbi:MAG TPA: protein kinase [Myxococcaceae bacterium]|nr:protein kinase [Myxococcaceae bacterium]
MTSSFPSARLRPFRPQPFGRYTLLSHLATGGMGEIYLARLEGSQGFEKLCVIKKLLPQLAADSEFVARFVGEATTLVKLSHGSIAQVLDMGLHEGEAYMALEYVDGKDLRKVAGRVRDRQMPLPLTFVLYVMGRVLDALAYAHRKRDDDEKEINLVHRDISPQNILISYEGEVKVIDFGLAKSRLSAAKTNPSIILGKFLYMSPEQARHQPVDRRSDLYAVGLCLYELISGHNPFDSVAPGELMPTVANPRIVPLNEMEPLTPPSVAQLVMKALAVDPAQRFQNAEEFRGKLQGCLREIDPNAGPESVSRFMRDLFSTEFQGERKLLAQLKDAARTGEQAARPPGADTPARAANPQLPPRTIKLDGPAEPLSFQPTPRSRDGRPVTDGETRPGIPVGPEETTRPGATVASPEPVSRSRVRPGMSSLASTTTETASIEVRPEDFDRPAPPVPAPLPAAAGERSQATTVEVPVPLVPAAAIPPGLPAPAPAASTPRAAEPGRPLMPQAPSASPAARPAAPPAPARPAPSTPPVSAPAAESPSTETVRANLPPMQDPAPAVPSALLTTLPLPSFSALMPGSGSRETTDPEGLPPLALEPPRFPSSPPAPPREPPRSASGLRPAINDRGGASSRSPEPQMSLAEELAARGGVITRNPEPPPMSLAEEMAALPPVPAGPRVSASSRPTEPALTPVPDKLPLSAAEADRRGLEDTHPRYKVKGETPHIHDTQPGVVIDEEALAQMEAEDSSQPIVGGLLEEPSSSTSRPKPPRRLLRASSPGMASLGRPGAQGRSSGVRAFEDDDVSGESGPTGPTVPSDPEFAVPTGEVDVDVDMDMDMEPAARGPREDTRRTPIPTRLGEPLRRIHREDARRSPQAGEKKRSWLWPVLTVVLLAVVGGALAMTYPELKPLVDKALGKPSAKLPPAVPLAPRAVEPEPTPAPAPVAAPAPEAAASPPQAAPGSAQSPEAVKSAPAGEGDEPDFFLPLTTQPPAKKTPARPPRKTARKENLTELQKEWAQAGRAFDKLTDMQSCENSKVGNLCQRFELLQNEVSRSGDSNDRELMRRVKNLRGDIDKAIKSIQ